MPIRALTTFENDIASEVVELGNLKLWEFAAFLEAPLGPLLEFSTRRNAFSADPSQEIINRTGSSQRVVIHHNHLSQESLSFPDWNGLTEFAEETFAHCADGTIYWGKVLKECAVKAKVNNPGTAETDAANLLFNILQKNYSSPYDTYIATFFRKEVINRAMRIRNWVEYEFAWGSNPIIPPPLSGGLPQTWSAGQIGQQISVYIDQAATALAPTL